MPHDTLIIGGGVLGAATAHHLARDGVRTLLVDRRDAGRATSAGAGIIAPETNTRDGDAWFHFGIEAGRYYPALIEQLRETGAPDTGYARCGKLTVAATDDEVEPFGEMLRVVRQRQRTHDLPAASDFDEISPAEARERFPALGNVQRACWLTNAARVDGRQLEAALRHAGRAHGLAERDGSVERILMQGGRATGVVVDGEELYADAVVVAAGAWSNALLTPFSVQIPVAPQRGQIAHLDLPTGTFDRDTGDWPVVTGFHGHYLVAWPGGRVVGGATRETDSGFVPETTAAGVVETLSEVLRVAPGLSTASVREVRVGLRPYSADGLPVLGRLPGVEGLFLATGNGPTGLTLGPLSGRVVAGLVQGRTADAEIAAFGIERFLSHGPGAS